MRALVYIAALSAGCAAVPGGPESVASPPEQAFQGVKVVALVHELAPGEPRRRDPLDALQDALEERGREVVTLELVGRPPADLAAVEELARLTEAAAERTGAEAGQPGVASVGPRAAPVLAQLGADALVVYVRTLFWQAPRPTPFPGPTTLAPMPTATATLAIVARDGTVVALSWGGDPFAGVGLANAAEAVDAALTLLAPPPAE